MLRRTMLKGAVASAAAAMLGHRASADEVLKMGISIPLTGAGFNAVGRQLQAAIKLYVQQHGNVVAGRKTGTYHSGRWRRGRHRAPHHPGHDR